MSDDTEASHSIDRTIRYKTEDVVHQIQEYNIDLKANHIYLLGEPQRSDHDAGEPGVEFAMANRFIKNLNILMRTSQDPILIHMKTCGGDWHEGMAIYDAIRACPNPVTILNYTHARSMSSLIFYAADRRVMMPHSTFMIHQGSSGFEGTYKQMQTFAKEDARCNTIMLDIYIDILKTSGSMSKWSRSRVKDWLIASMNGGEEVYFSAEEATSLGFADAVFGAGGCYDWGALLTF